MSANQACRRVSLQRFLNTAFDKPSKESEAGPSILLLSKALSRETQKEVRMHGEDGDRLGAGDEALISLRI